MLKTLSRAEAGTKEGHFYRPLPVDQTPTPPATKLRKLDNGHSSDRFSHAGKTAKMTPISDALPFGRLWYGEPNGISNAIGYAKFFSRSHNAVIRVRNEAGSLVETHEQAGEFVEP